MEIWDAFQAVSLYNELVQTANNAIDAFDYHSASLIKSIIDGTEIELSETKERDKALWIYSPNKYAPIYLKIKEAMEKGFAVKYVATKWEDYYNEKGLTTESGEGVYWFDSIKGVLITNYGWGNTEECYIQDVSKILIVVRDEEEDVLIEVINVQSQQE